MNSLKISSLFLVLPLFLSCSLQKEDLKETRNEREVEKTQTLEFSLQQKREESTKNISVEIRKTFEDAINDLRKTGIVDKALKVGDKAPSFTLLDSTSEEVSLKKLLKKGPVVVSFYRGGWCPYCSIELAALKEALPQIHDLGAELVAISPEKPDKSRETIEKMNLQFKVLSDKASKVAEYFGIAFEVPNDVNGHYKDFGINLKESNAGRDNKLPIPATYVIDQEQIIRFAFVEPDYTKRAEPKDVINILKGLN
ncbi:MAG: peroxiredoxin-like family protein [Candidatus Caenarcaniphilales bacterium]|nr:peroxiredoxin-like family protein [Candidatus Caenarcaniphilales bacterium]